MKRVRWTGRGVPTNSHPLIFDSDKRWHVVVEVAPWVFETRRVPDPPAAERRTQRVSKRSVSKPHRT